jgi:hypothetical protein
MRERRSGSSTSGALAPADAGAADLSGTTGVGDSGEASAADQTPDINATQAAWWANERRRRGIVISVAPDTTRSR